MITQDGQQPEVDNLWTKPQDAVQGWIKLEFGYNFLSEIHLHCCGHKIICCHSIGVSRWNPKLIFILTAKVTPVANIHESYHLETLSYMHAYFLTSGVLGLVYVHSGGKFWVFCVKLPRVTFFSNSLTHMHVHNLAFLLCQDVEHDQCYLYNNHIIRILHPQQCLFPIRQPKQDINQHCITQ